MASSKNNILPLLSDVVLHLPKKTQTSLNVKQFFEVFAFVQHHKSITPLLDWSEDPLVALYFATTEESSKDKCSSLFASIYVVDPLEINNYVGYRGIPNSKDIRETFVYTLINDRSFFSGYVLKHLKNQILYHVHFL